MYTSIPAEQLKPLILQVLRYQQTAPEVVKEIILLVDIIPKQNYFHFLNKFYIQEEGLNYGSTITIRILPPTLRRKIDNQMLQKFKILGYFRYADDILIIYNEKNTNIERVLFSFNELSSNLTSLLRKKKLTR